jgi:hypothetical protein
MPPALHFTFIFCKSKRFKCDCRYEVHVTNRVTPPGSDDNQNTAQLMTAGVVHVINLDTPRE